MISKIKYPKLKTITEVCDELYDTAYDDIMHLWSLLPKNDFWVARIFCDASCSYLHSLNEIRERCEKK